MRVLVLDLTHGGDVLAMGYLSRGCDVTAVDIYGTSPGIASRLEREGVRCPRTAPGEDFDLAVVPVHAPSSYLGGARAGRTITHHVAVGELARFDLPTVEITGARGKTSTAQVLTFLMAREGRRVLSLTSSGLRSVRNEETVLEDKVSIAPATLLRLSLSYTGHDLGVFEVSLGGTGLAEVSVVTGLQDDYPIAKGTRRAFDGKSQMLALAKGPVVLPFAEMGMWSPLLPSPDRAITFGRGGDVEATVLPHRLGEGGTLRVRSGGWMEEIPLAPGYLSPSYELAFSCALAAASALGTDPSRAARHLSQFRGAPGRGEVVSDAGGTVVRERNPGVSAGSLEFQLRTLTQRYGCKDIGLVLDPVDRKVCEKLDLDRVMRACLGIPEVKGLYLMEDAGPADDGWTRVRTVEEARVSHPVVLWAVKEGYL